MMMRQFVDALQRMDKKIGRMADALGSVVEEIDRMKITNRVDTDLLRSLAEKAMGVGGQEMESLITYRDGMTALQRKLGNPDEEMEYVRGLVQEIGKEPFMAELRDKMDQGVSDLLAKLNRLIDRRVDSQVTDLRVLFAQTERAHRRAEEGLEKVEHRLSTELEALAGKQMEDIKTRQDALLAEHERSLQLLREKQKEQFDVLEEAQREVDEKVAGLRAVAEGYERRVRGALTAASLAMQKSFGEIKKQADDAVANQKEDTNRFLGDEAERHRMVLASFQAANDEALVVLQDKINESLLELEGKKQALDDLAEKTQTRIIDTEKAIASLGNQLPRNQRVRIRHGN